MLHHPRKLLEELVFVYKFYIGKMSLFAISEIWGLYIGIGIEGRLRALINFPKSFKSSSISIEVRLLFEYLDLVHDFDHPLHFELEIED